MIDLAKIKRKYYQIRLENGKILRIKPPTRTLMLELMEFENIEGKTESQAIEKLYELMTGIFNHNDNNIKFTKNKIERMIEEPTTLIYILQDYLNYSFEIMGE